MIFLDSNIILRYLTEPTDPASERMQQRAEALIQAAERGEKQVTLSEIVLHECSSVLASKHHYNRPAAEIADYLGTILGLSGMRLPRGEKAIFLRALKMYRDNPELELADSMIAARAEKPNVSLATFDRRLSQLPTVKSWFEE